MLRDFDIRGLVTKGEEIAAWYDTNVTVPAHGHAVTPHAARSKPLISGRHPCRSIQAPMEDSIKRSTVSAGGEYGVAGVVSN